VKKVWTGKRETAWSLIILLVVAGFHAATGTDPEMVAARSRLVEVLAWPVISFAAFAYGADWISKQTSWGGPPARDDYAGKVD
jgi:hypothetical protein